jgi:hypothetical protein
MCRGLHNAMVPGVISITSVRKLRMSYMDQVIMSISKTRRSNRVICMDQVKLVLSKHVVSYPAEVRVG